MSAHSMPTARGLHWWLRRGAPAVLATFMVVFGVSGVAYAFFSSSDSSNFAAAVGDALPQGATPTATATGTTVAINFAQVSSTSSRPVTTYKINRYASATPTVVAATFFCTWSITAPNCSESNVPAGTWLYSDTAQFGTIWFGAESVKSSGVVVGADTTPPTVTSIDRVGTSPTNATSVQWTATFSESVTGVDAADFALVRAGVTGGTITSVTGSGTTWTVTAGTGTGNGTFGLNVVDNDTIIDAASNKLGGTGAANGNFTGQTYTIDKTFPTVSSINRVGISPTGATSVQWTVTFSESVTGVDATDFALVRTGTVAGGSVTAVTGSGTGWTVTSGTGTGSGTIGLNLVDNDTVIDTAGNMLGGTGANNGNFTGQTYSIDKAFPTVTSINRVGTSPTNASSVQWTVIFSRSVSGVDVTDFALAQAGGVSGALITTATGSGTTWTVTAGTGSGDGTLGLDLVDNDTIIDTVGNVLGGTGASNGNFTGQTYAIDKTSPTITAPNAGSPAQVSRNKTDVTVTITGTNFAAGATVTFTNGPDVNGVTVASYTSISATSIVIKVNTGGNGARGLYDLTVTNPSGGGSVTALNSFSVTN